MSGNNPWASQPADEGWKKVDFYGWFQDSRFPWVFHADHGWEWLLPNPSGDKLWYFDPAMGWLYSSESTRDKIFSVNRFSWLTYQKGSQDPRIFWDFSINDRVEYPVGFVSKPGLNGFDFAHSVIPIEDILPGGPNRDGIPPVFAPEFVTADVYDAYRASEEDDFTQDFDETVISVTIDGITHAYPIRMLNWHEVVNDEINGYPFMVTYCPLCGTGMAFSRRVNGRELNFAISGLLWADNVLMWDHETESLWSQLGIRAVTGPQFGNRLEWIPSRQMRWSVWKRDYPYGVVLDHTQIGVQRPYRTDPYKWVRETPEPLFPANEVRNDLLLKAWVLGVVVDNVPHAFARDQIPRNVPVVDAANGVEVMYRGGSNLASARRLDTGEAIPVVESFWFAWASIHPETTLFPR